MRSTTRNGSVKVAALVAIGLALSWTPALAQDREHDPRRHRDAAPQMQTASDAYWDAVRASTGPIGFPQAVPDEDLPWRDRVRARRFGPVVFASVPFVAAPTPVYVPVPVYVPGPPVYVPVPSPPAHDSANAVASPAPRRPEKFYVIPGCYGGNKPPQRAALPPGCDIKKLRVNTW